MSVLFLSKSGVIQPSGPVQIDRRNALTHGLSFALVPGNSVRDVAGLKTTTPINGPKPAATTRGMSLRLNGSNQSIDTGQKFTTPNGTILLFAANVGASGASTCIACQSTDDAGNNVGVGWQSGNFIINGSWAPATWTTGSEVLLVGTWGNAGIKSYVNGELRGTHASTSTPQAPAGNYCFHVGAFSYSGGRIFQFLEDTFLLCKWDRALSASEIALVSKRPWQLFSSRQALWAPASGGGSTTITCIVGNAAANGTTAAVTRTIATTAGNSSANGTTANLIRTIATSTGNAVADGLTAAVTRTIATTVGNSVADGTTAAVTRVIATTLGNAVADGSTSAVTRIIATATGDAAAAGITASIVLDGSVTIACTVANAVADGTLAAVTRTIATTVGNAVADGLTAGLIRTIATTTGNAVADGITATITTVGQTTISCTPGDAVADGAMATVMRTITADPGNAVANGSIAALLRVIAAGPGNAVADGLTASILGATGIVCTPGNAVAAGATASIVGGHLGAPAYVYAILAESRSYTARTEARSQAVAAESRTQNVPATI